MSVPRLPRFPLLAKASAIALVLFALMLALQAVSGLVAERAGRLREAERSVADSLAAGQTLVGPVLLRSCSESWERSQGEGRDKQVVTERHDFTLSETPAGLDIHAEVAMEPGYRRIFKVNGYVTKAHLDAKWLDGLALQAEATHVGSRLHCDAPLLFVAVGDSRGVRSATIVIDKASAPVLAGTGHRAHPHGFHADVAAAFAGARQGLHAEIALELVGTGELAFAPVGGDTRVELAADWPHPSFAGRFLPVERQVSGSGFRARWQMNALATSAPQAARDGGVVCGLDEGAPERPAGVSEQAPRRPCIESFGVTFIDPVSPYVLSDRATKYGLLFIALTFVGVGAVEVLRRVRVHPIQYLLVGSAVAVFFLLLVSLSEHVSFAVAYLGAASACTALLTFYGTFVLRGTRAGAAFGSAIALLYAALYALLQLEQTALLLGSLLLFAVLGGLMAATRRIDWYALFAQMRAPNREPDQAGNGGRT